MIAAIGLSVTALVPAIAATPRSASHSHAKAAQQTYGTACKSQTKTRGTFKYSDWQFPDTLNLYQTGASVSTETIYAEQDPVGTLRPNGTMLPDLIQSLKGTNGGKTWTAVLKQGLKWSNGQPLTAADVRFGVQIIQHPDSGPYAPSIGADLITRMDLIGKYTIVFHLSAPFAPFVLQTVPGIYAWPTVWSGSWAKGDVKAATDKLFQDTTFNFENNTFPFSGPYVTDTFVQNDRITLKPNKYYRALSCGPGVANPIFVFYASKPGLIAAAGAKETDVTTNYTPADLATLAKYKTFRTDTTPAFEVEHLTLNTDAQYNGKTNPLHDTRVRVALALGLDKITLIRSATGVSTAVAKQLVSWSPLIYTPRLHQAFAVNLNGQWDPIAKKYQYNTGSGQAEADAKKLLAQAGYSGGGFSVDGMTTTGNPVRQAEFAVMAADWAKLGVTFVPTYIPASKLFADWNAGAPPHLGTFQIAMWTDVSNPDPNAYVISLDSKFIDREKTVHSATNGNFAAVHNKLIDQAFKNGAQTLSKSVRAKWYKILQEQVNMNAYWICLYYRTFITTSDGVLKTYSPNGTGLGIPWNAFEWTTVKSG
jgi:peptide/nickel transport system substrate-binding protein